MAANPRRTAFDILLRIDKEKSYADILLDHALSGTEIQGPDRGLLTELVYGVLRRQGTLDHIASQCSSIKISKLERNVLLLLRLGIYQEVFLDRVPISAAVNETVKLAKTLAPRAAGFVNAVLRQVDRQRDAIRYPDPAREPASFLAARYSHPRWLVEDWITQLGPSEAEALARAMVEPPPLTLRVNPLRIGRDELIALLGQEGVVAKPATHAPHALVVEGAASPARLPGFHEGLFTVQDESSQLAALFLAPRPEERILDLCAAPGGKSTYLAQLMDNTGSVLACDISERKVRLVTETASRLGISIIETRALDASHPLPGVEPGSFDRVLVDAPCAGLGVIRRNPEGKWWKAPEDVDDLAAAQRRILANAAGYVRSGGTLLYATCSTSRRENEEVVEDFLRRHDAFTSEALQDFFPGLDDLFTPEGYFRSWPHRHRMDGFFACRMRKKKITDER